MGAPAAAPAPHPPSASPCRPDSPHPPPAAAPAPQSSRPPCTHSPAGAPAPRPRSPAPAPAPAASPPPAAAPPAPSPGRAPPPPPPHTAGAPGSSPSPPPPPAPGVGAPQQRQVDRRQPVHDRPHLLVGGDQRLYRLHLAHPHVPRLRPPPQRHRQLPRQVLGAVPRPATPPACGASSPDRSVSRLVPDQGGWFGMGREDGHPGERPRHRVWVDGFAIA